MQPPASAAAYFVVIVCALSALFLLHSSHVVPLLLPLPLLLLAVWHSIWGFSHCCHCSLRSLLCCFSANVNQLLIVKIMNDLHGLPQSCTASFPSLPLSLLLSLSVTLLPCFACLGTFSGNAAALGASNLDYLHNCLAVGNLCKELKFCSLKLSAYSDILHQ